MIAARFKDLRQNTPTELISNTQRTAIYRIEKGVNPKSRNFVSDTLLTDYADYFGIEKSELIFGDSMLLEFTLYHMFSQLFYQIVPDDNNVGLTIDRTKIQNNIDRNIIDSFLELFYIFGDFGRWRHLQKFQNKNTDIDYMAMFEIIWRLIKNKVILSFQEHVIVPLFDEEHTPFQFNLINKYFNIWYHKQFVKIIIPDALKKLESDSIFKMGFMVKNLIEHFLNTTHIMSYLEDVPIDKYYLPITNYTIDVSKIKTEEEDFKVAIEYLRWLNRYNSLETTEDAIAFADEKFFEEFDFVTEEKRPMIDQTSRTSIQELLNDVIQHPENYEKGYILHGSTEEIPGILTVNSQVSKLFQTKIAEVFLKQIDDLVRYQNIFINFINWDELETFL
ncbi:hypothetical protein SGADD02_00287 [Streptococcus gallolyticus]|uniref:Uncharacterized protein n=1 Tax=Streptococcus gallolyticus TaxID=315405 RepID=A0A139NBL3_9STRE|nr:hypothetical protein [Streptococcus gallolyticus]KXT73253.1 hypothetical protein SGADD02_00287 [Streptococcus gallolyticus]